MDFRAATGNSGMLGHLNVVNGWSHQPPLKNMADTSFGQWGLFCWGRTQVFTLVELQGQEMSRVTLVVADFSVAKWKEPCLIKSLAAIIYNAWPVRNAMETANGIFHWGRLMGLFFMGDARICWSCSFIHWLIHHDLGLGSFSCLGMLRTRFLKQVQACQFRILPSMSDS